MMEEKNILAFPSPKFHLEVYKKVYKYVLDGLNIIRDNDMDQIKILEEQITISKDIIIETEIENILLEENIKAYIESITRLDLYINKFKNLDLYPNQIHKFLYYVYSHYRYTSNNYQFALPNETFNIIQPIIENYYVNIGDYQYHYFCYINPRSPYIHALNGMLKLTPENFELASNTTFNVYYDILQKLSDITHSYDVETYLNKLHIPSALYGGKIPFPGWTRDDLIKAIESSGLVIDKGGQYASLPIKSLRIPYKENYELPFYREHIAWPLGYLLPRSYYETLYRRLFNTTKYVNWEVLCKTKNIDLNVLKFIAITEFDLDIREVSKMNIPELCSKLFNEALIKRQILHKIALEAISHAPQVIYRPGSVFIKPEMIKYFKYEPKEEKKLKEYEYIINECQNVNSISKRDLMFIVSVLGIRELLPKNINDISKEEICRIINRYIRLLEQARQPI